MTITTPATVDYTGKLMPNQTYRGNLSNPFFVPSPISNLDVQTLNANTINAANANLSNTYLGDSLIYFSNIAGNQLLESVGTGLFFNGDMLITSGSISNIEDWAQYPAVCNVDMNDKALYNTQLIVMNDATVVGPGASNILLTNNNVLEINGAPVAATWSSNVAQTNVDMGGLTLSNALDVKTGILTVGQINGPTGATKMFFNNDNQTGPAGFRFTFDGTIEADYVAPNGAARTNFTQGVGLGNGVGDPALLTYGSLATDATGTDLFWNTQKITTGNEGSACNWWAYPAQGTVNMDGRDLDQVANLQQNTGTAYLWEVEVFQNISQDDNKEAQFGTTYISGPSLTVGTGPSAGGTLNLCDKVTLLPVPIASSNNVLFYNNAPVGGGGPSGAVSDWSLYPAISDIGPTGTISTWNVGSNTANTVIRGDSAAVFAEANITLSNDGGNFIGGSADITLTTGNGLFGNINLTANPGNGLTFQQGGLVDIKANSASGLTPLALSRVNVEAATVTCSAGALGTLAYVPGAVNLLSGLGAGVQVLTTAGPINIAGGTSTTVAGGAGVTLDGGITGVTINNGDLFVNKIQPNGNPNTQFTSAIATDGVLPFTNGATGTTYVPKLALSSPNGSVTIGNTGTYPNQTITLQATGGVGSTTTIFVSNVSGSDTTGTGTATTPYATIAKALTVAATFADSIPVVIQLFAGTYTENITITRSNTFLSGATITAQETVINGSITLAVVTSTLSFNTAGIQGVQCRNIVISGTPVNTVEYYLTSLILIAPSTVVPFTATQGGAQNFSVIMNAVVCSATDTVAATISNVKVNCIQCLFTTPAATNVIQTTGFGIFTLLGSTVTSTSASATAGALVSVQNTVLAGQIFDFNQSVLSYTSATVDTGGNKCCVQFANTIGVIASIINSTLVCSGAVTGTPLIQCIQKTGAGSVSLTYGNIQARSTAVWIAPGVTRTVLQSVQQGLNAVGGGTGDYLAWDGNQWANGSTTVTLGRGAGNAADVTCVNIGQNAGNTANTNAVAIGNGAGNTSAAQTISIGTNAGSGAGTNSIYIGSTTGVPVGAGLGQTIVLNAQGAVLSPGASGTCKIAPIRTATATPTTFTQSSYGANSGMLTYNATAGASQYEITYNTSAFRIILITAPNTITLSPTSFGSTYIITSAVPSTIAFVTTALTTNDAGFFVYLKNGNNTANDITLSGISGATTLHGRTAAGTTNGQILIAYWSGTTLTAY